jgi:hypothetical protein
MFEAMLCINRLKSLICKWKPSDNIPTYIYAMAPHVIDVNKSLCREGTTANIQKAL